MNYAEQIVDDFLYSGYCPKGNKEFHPEENFKQHSAHWWDGGMPCVFCGYRGVRWEHDKDWILDDLEYVYCGNNPELMR